MNKDEAENGIGVKHIIQGYTGILLDTTKIKTLFEDPNDIIEYRVLADNGQIKVASLKNLEVYEDVLIGDKPMEDDSFWEYDVVDCQMEKDVASDYSRLGYINHCHTCKETIDETLAKCPNCGWFICGKCGACGCSYARQ